MWAWICDTDYLADITVGILINRCNIFYDCKSPNSFFVFIIFYISYLPVVVFSLSLDLSLILSLFFSLSSLDLYHSTSHSIYHVFRLIITRPVSLDLYDSVFSVYCYNRRLCITSSLWLLYFFYYSSIICSSIICSIFFYCSSIICSIFFYCSSIICSIFFYYSSIICSIFFLLLFNNLLSIICSIFFLLLFNNLLSIICSIFFTALQ